MNAKANFIEMVHPGFVMSDYLALIILEQSEEELINELSLLFPHGKYKVGVIKRTQAGIESLLKKARESNIPLIFLQPQPPTFSKVTKNRDSFSVNLITPGSSKSADLAAQFIAHPKTTNLSWIGYQTYLTSPESLAQLQARYFSPLRLGSFRENFVAAEPLIRHNSLNLIDLTAIRYSDAPDGLGTSPNGLYAEELCQLVRYMGVSSNLDACYIWGYPKGGKSSPITTRLLAQVLWHLFESISTGQNEDPYCPNQQVLFTHREVYIGSQNHILFFLHSNQTERWWIKLLLEDGISYFIPCTYEEYAAALKGELPATWLRYYQKLNLL
ncbi:MAG: hypothetical protein FWD56_02535 [Bacteroidales bacterium]|nr:hypothetical protein [Bacteroidales bacterium]